MWDLSCVESRITSGKKPEVAKMPDEEVDKGMLIKSDFIMSSSVNNRQAKAVIFVKHCLLAQKLCCRHQVYSSWSEG